MPTKRQIFYETVAAAVRDFSEHGFDGVARLEHWVLRIREVAEAAAVPLHEANRALGEHLRGVYARLVDRGGLLKTNPGIARFTVERLRPQMRRELDRRILAAAQLIKLNREQAIDKTIQRFSGWATSLPIGGSRVVEKRKEASKIKRSISGLSYIDRRLHIDQGHKLAAAINDVAATHGGAIAAVWHSNWRQKNYNFREDHKERDDLVYLIRDSWARAKGFVKPNSDGYTDEITQPGEEVFCRCFYQYLYHLRELPSDMLTEKGKRVLAETKVAA